MSLAERQVKGSRGLYPATPPPAHALLPLLLLGLLSVFPNAPFLRFGQITQAKTELAATPTTATGKTQDGAQAKQDTAEIHGEVWIKSYLIVLEIIPRDISTSYRSKRCQKSPENH